MKKNEWLLDATELLYKMSAGREIRTVWKDFLLWAAYQSGHPSAASKLQQKALLDNYPADVQPFFYHLFYMVSYVVAQWPNQNVLLKIMHSARFAGKYHYSENDAKNLLLRKVGGAFDDSYRYRQMEIFKLESDTSDGWENVVRYPQNGNDEFSRLWRMGSISFVDDSCSISGGSRIIAVSNVYRENCPVDFPNRMMLVASDAHDITFSLMSFIQASLMGMACYVLTDFDYGVNLSCSMELFAPPTAICSPAYYSDEWNEMRMQAMLSTRFEGIF